MADVAANLYSWSTTASSNSPADATTIGAGLADNFQEIQKVVRQDLASKGADIASATTTDIGAVAGKQHDITGTTTITSFGTVAAGIEKRLQFDGALILTHSANLILPGGANITTAAGDVADFTSEGGGVWRCASYMKASGAPANMSPITNSLSGDVALNNTANYFDGPSVAQGTAGKWFVSGTVIAYDTAATAGFQAKLWDGTTVIASAQSHSLAANLPVSISLSGYITSPAGNLRISVKDGTATTGVMAFNTSGNSKDCTITAIRIA